MRKIIFCVVLLLTYVGVWGQSSLNFEANNLTQSTVGFNFLMGDNAADFATTPKAFGSGIGDLSGNYILWSPWILEPYRHHIGLTSTIGYKLAKYRFEKNYVFNDNGFMVDTVASHKYDDSFFSRQGSKLVLGKLHVPLIVYLPVHNWFNRAENKFGIFAGAYYDYYLFAYHKNYHTVDGKLVKSKQRNADISKYFNKHNVGITGGVKVFDFFLHFDYVITPLFSNKLPYELHEARVSLSYTLNWLNLF